MAPARQGPSGSALGWFPLGGGRAGALWGGSRSAGAVRERSRVAKMRPREPGEAKVRSGSQTALKNSGCKKCPQGDFLVSEKDLFGRCHHQLILTALPLHPFGIKEGPKRHVLSHVLQ